MAKLLAAFAVCLFFIACHLNSNEKDPSDIAGGPCTFDTTVHPVIVKQIVPAGSGFLRFVFQFPYSSDSFDHLVNIRDYESRFGTSITNIKLDDTLQYLDLRTIGGSCAGVPEVYLKKFEAGKK